MKLRSVVSTACCSLLLTVVAVAQMGRPAQDPSKMPSPPADASVELAGQTVTIHYNSPRMKGRKIFGGLVPYGKEWRTGANPATTLKTPVNLKIGTLEVPAGTYTLFTLPNPGQWMFIVSKKTGEWGIPYPEGNDLGRTPMMGKTMSSPQEDMSISFENTHGKTTELHIKWETTDECVKVTAQ